MTEFWGVDSGQEGYLSLLEWTFKKNSQLDPLCPLFLLFIKGKIQGS